MSGDPALEHGHAPDEIAARLARGARPGHLRDLVYGAMDGAVTTLAIVAGVEGAGLSTGTILALGFANIFADGFSMAAGAYSGIKAEAEDARRLRAVEERHINLVPEGEREELRQILAAKGLEGTVLIQATAAITRNRRAWIDLMLVEEYGITATAPAPLASALATFGAFLAAGIVPLSPFVLGLDHGFAIAVAQTLAIFFVIGALRSRWSLVSWWRSGLETLAIGGTAAAIAFAVGRLFHL